MYFIKCAGIVFFPCQGLNYFIKSLVSALVLNKRFLFFLRIKKKNRSKFPRLIGLLFHLGPLLWQPQAQSLIINNNKIIGNQLFNY